jgi:carbamate kinase
VTTVVALGGNALIRAGERGTIAEETANLRRTCRALQPLLAEPRLVITHGNGPQVGNELVRHERAADEVPPLPLYLAVAQTQAEIGALIEEELSPLASRPVVCVLTHVRVDPADPAFAKPTKPVGPFYDEDRARVLARERGWTVAADSDRGWRRVVPSPSPLSVVELDGIRALLGAGALVVCCGGGGIPVTHRNGLRGVDAVIDKDRASALLGIELGAARLLILTDVPAVLRGFGTGTGEEEIAELTAEEAQALAPELSAGSMRPKVEASAEFVRATGGEALIASADGLESALRGRGGTRVVP